jgi:predicted transcriptional regulator of viral defense system
MTNIEARPDLHGLEARALVQGGYFDRADAHEFGISDSLLSHHVRTGRFERSYPGVFRLHAAPFARNDDLLLAWVWTNYRGVISHESALALYDLSDVMPGRVHLTVPPSFRRTSADYDLHWARLEPGEITEYEGLSVTTPARTIVDAATAGTGPEQIEMAIRQAIARGLASSGQVKQAAARRGYRHRRTVQPMIEEFIHHAVR